MPVLQINTNVSIEDIPSFLKTISGTVAQALGRPESYVMIQLSDQQNMLFAGTDAPLAYLELKSLGLDASQTTGLSQTLCQTLQHELSIDPSRIYIEFSAPERAMFGWNGGTF